MAVGESDRVGGFRLAGVEVVAVETAGDCAAAWDRVHEDCSVVILTPAAHAALADRLRQRPTVISVVLPG
jgi:vacuolar-type H+-ATPase subunit F/Vma7